MKVGRREQYDDAYHKRKRADAKRRREKVKNDPVLKEQNRNYQIEYQREWRTANRDIALEYSRKWRKGNQEKAKSYARKSAATQWKKNPEKLLERNRKWIEANQDRVKKYRRERNLKLNYGMTIEDYDRMLGNQGGNCAIGGCGRPACHVDHCHTTGKVRGLLCRQCNTALGSLGESVERINGLIPYLMSNRNS